MCIDRGGCHIDMKISDNKLVGNGYSVSDLSKYIVRRRGDIKGRSIIKLMSHSGNFKRRKGGGLKFFTQRISDYPTYMYGLRFYTDPSRQIPFSWYWIHRTIYKVISEFR